MMKPWQWIAVPLALASLALVGLFPFAEYADPDQPATRPSDTGVTIDFGWRHGFLPIWRVRELNAPPRQLASSGNANVNWLVLMVLALGAALPCGFVFGYRPQAFPGRRKVLAEACGGFALLALAFMPTAMIVVIGFSWKWHFLSATGLARRRRSAFASGSWALRPRQESL
jgi:uncharacterized BrkB/YihY/UPF0761 family membrane protein